MNRRDFLRYSSTAISLGFLARGTLFGQNANSTPTAPTTEFKALRRGVGVFMGQGGTIGWLVNREALVVIDTQFAATAAICLAGLPGREGRPIDCVVNTHHHADHTGGNGVFKPVAKAIVAQENVPRLQREAAAGQPAQTVPVCADTLFAERWSRDAGDETVSAHHFGPAHTGGDAIVFFEKANVVHMGDLVFNRIYPVVDRPAGARFRGWVRVLETAMKVYPKDAIYVFGHGNPKFGVTGTQADLAAMRDYIAALLAHVEAEIKAGKSKEAVVKLENMPGFSDLHVPAGRGNRLPGNLAAAYDELTAKA